MMIDKKIKYIFFAIVSIFSIMPNVLAKDAKATCHYELKNAAGQKLDADDLIYTYNATKNKLDVEIPTLTGGSIKINPGLSMKDFVTSDNKLDCPTIYAKLDTANASSRIFTYKLSIKTKKDYEKIKPSSKSKVTGKADKLLQCKYNSDKYTLSVVMNTRTIEIVESKVNGNINVALTEYKYDDFVIKNAKGEPRCNNKLSLNIFCTNRNGEMCSVSKKSLSIANGEEMGADEGNEGWTEDYYKPIDGSQFVCNKMISDNLLQEIIKIYRTIILLIVVGVVIFGMLDFFKAVSVGDDKTFKSVGKRFMNRLIIAIILVMLPTILELILTLFGDENMKNCLDKIV